MNKIYLNSIIVLAIVVAFIAIFGTTNHFMGYYNPKGTIAKNNSSKPAPKPKPSPKPDPKPDPDPAPEDKEIYGYKCKYANCQILNGTKVINEKFVFIVDGEENVVLFDITTKEIVQTYKSVSLSGNYFVVKNSSDVYGVISVEDKVNELIPFEFTYIDYVSKNDNYILTKHSSSYVADNKGHAITLTYNAQIMDYNELYIITKTTAEEYHIFNFNNRTELTEYVNSKRLFIELVKDYVGVLTDDYKYQLHDFRNGNKLITEYQLTNKPVKVHAVINSNNELEIYADDNLAKTIDLS